MLVQKGIAWDETADVVVIGYGGAGAVAAVTASENGASVLIVEKQGQEGFHNNTSMSGGIFITPSDTESGLEYMSALCQVAGVPAMSWTNRAVIRAWAEYASTSKSWVEARGGNAFENSSPGAHPHLPGGAFLPKMRFRGFGAGLARFLSDLVKERNISVLYGTRATRLVTNTRGRVLGVEVESAHDGHASKRRLRAGKAVVLAAGGFEFDEQSKLNYLRVYPTFFTGSEALTGDGLRMGMSIGAKLWHMNCVSAKLVFKAPDIPMAFHIDFRGGGRFARAPGRSEKDIPVQSGHIIVDRNGNRFTSENIKDHALYYELTGFDTHRLLYPRVPSYFVFDHRRFQSGTLTLDHSGAAGPTRIYKWSQDNSHELEQGWIKTGESIRDLARKVGLPADALERTVKTFNSYCSKGKDPSFGRKPSELIPLVDPPYYAMELWPGGPNTQGGPQRNARGQILSVDGDPIPGLYGCGELGSIYGMLYPGGGANLTECFAFGRIVGENVARERNV